MKMIPTLYVENVIDTETLHKVFCHRFYVMNVLIYFTVLVKNSKCRRKLVIVAYNLDNHMHLPVAQNNSWWVTQAIIMLFVLKIHKNAVFTTLFINTCLS